LSEGSPDTERLYEFGQEAAGRAASTDSDNYHGTLSAAPNQVPYSGKILGRRLVSRVYSCPMLSIADNLPHGVVRQRTINNRSAGVKVYTVHITSLESESQQHVVSIDTVFINRLICSFFHPRSGCVVLF
jgi:hypothetical protein